MPGEVLSGIQLAVEANRDRAGSASVGLIVKDLESDYASFLDDFSELLNTDRPLAVIGPLLSKNLPVMAELAERAHIPLITPAATLPNVRRLGNYVFSTALTYQLQAKRIAAYAIKEQGFRRFCILHPDTTYGRELARLFAQEVRQHEGEVIAIESYKEGEADVSAQLKRMKAEDLKRYGLSVPVDQTKLTGKLTKLDKKVFYTPGFDAIFIPGRAADAGIITSQLNFHDMKVPFLGTNGWNSPDFARTDDSSIDGAVFVDGFFMDSPSHDRAGFCRAVQKTVPNQPDTLCDAGLRCREIGARCGSKRRLLRRRRPRPITDTAGSLLPCGTGGVWTGRNIESPALPHTNQTRSIPSSKLRKPNA